MMNEMAHRRGLWRNALRWTLITGASLSVLLAGCGAMRVETPSIPTAIPSTSTPTPVPFTPTPVPSPTVTASPSPTPTATPASPSPFGAPPLEPSGHAAVMIPDAAQYLDALHDAPRYQIAVSYDPDTLTLQGTERVRMVNRSGDSLGEVYFRLYPNGSSLHGPARLDLLSVMDDWGQPLAWQEEDDPSVIRVELAEGWLPGAVLILNLAWTAQIPSDETRPWTREDGYGLFRQARGLTVLAEWFPMLAIHEGGSWRLDRVPDWGDPVYSEIAFHEVWVTAPKEYSVIATGLEVSVSESASSATRHFLSGPARDFFLAFASDLWVDSTSVGETHVRSYGFPEHAWGGATALAASADALRVFNSRFAAYPYRELDVLEAPLLGLLGMEYPGVILLANTIYTPDQRWRLEITAAHEVSHQWWYGVVGNDILLEPWLDEALATWSSGLYVETIKGRPDFQAQYEQWVERYQTGQRSSTVGAIVWPVERFRNSWDYVTTTYYKGAIALDALRKEIGDAAFFGALRRHYAESRFDVTTGQRLLDLFEQESGRDLGAFWREWFFSE